MMRGAPFGDAFIQADARHERVLIVASAARAACILFVEARADHRRRCRAACAPLRSLAPPLSHRARAGRRAAAARIHSDASSARRRPAPIVGAPPRRTISGHTSQHRLRRLRDRRSILRLPAARSATPAPSCATHQTPSLVHQRSPLSASAPPCDCRAVRRWQRHRRQTVRRRLRLSAPAACRRTPAHSSRNHQSLHAANSARR